MYSYDGTNITYYIDGALKDSFPYSSGIGASNEDLNIGYALTYGYSDRYFKGSLDDISIYNSAKDECGVMGLYIEERDNKQ